MAEIDFELLDEIKELYRTGKSVPMMVKRLRKNRKIIMDTIKEAIIIDMWFSKEELNKIEKELIEQIKNYFIQGDNLEIIAARLDMSYIRCSRLQQIAKKNNKWLNKTENEKRALNIKIRKLKIIQEKMKDCKTIHELATKTEIKEQTIKRLAESEIGRTILTSEEIKWIITQDIYVVDKDTANPKKRNQRRKKVKSKKIALIEKGSKKDDNGESNKEIKLESTTDGSKENDRLNINWLEGKEITVKSSEKVPKKNGLQTTGSTVKIKRDLSGKKRKKSRIKDNNEANRLSEIKKLIVKGYNLYEIVVVFKEQGLTIDIDGINNLINMAIINKDFYSIDELDKFRIWRMERKLAQKKSNNIAPVRKAARGTKNPNVLESFRKLNNSIDRLGKCQESNIKDIEECLKEIHSYLKMIKEIDSNDVDEFEYIQSIGKIKKTFGDHKDLVTPKIIGFMIENANNSDDNNINDKVTKNVSEFIISIFESNKGKSELITSDILKFLINDSFKRGGLKEIYELMDRMEEWFKDSKTSDTITEYRKKVDETRDRMRVKRLIEDGYSEDSIIKLLGLDVYNKYQNWEKEGKLINSIERLNGKKENNEENINPDRIKYSNNYIDFMNKYREEEELGINI